MILWRNWMMVLSDAIHWIVALLTGSFANSVAILAIAGVAYQAMSGHINLRRAGFAILGCFLIFGAAALAGSAWQSPDRVRGYERGIDEIATAAPEDLPSSYDPYAGAAPVLTPMSKHEFRQTDARPPGKP